MNIMPCTYKITFPDGKIYIGATQNLDKRIAKHVENSTVKPDLLISRWIRNYGAASMHVEVLFVSEDMSAVYTSERLCIIAFSAKFPDGLNLTDGGKGLQGVMYRDENSQKRSECRLRVWQDPDYRAKMSVIRTGRKQSEETCRRRSAAIKKVWSDPAYKARLAQSHAKNRNQ